SAKGAPADAQRYGEQVIAALLEPRSREADEDPALLDPVVDPRLQLSGQCADIGQDEYGRVLLENGIDAGGNVGAVRMHDLGVGEQRLLDVVTRPQQGLRLLAASSRNQSDALPLRSGVEEIDRPRRRFARDLDPGDLIAQLERQLEGGFRRRLARGEMEGGLA